MIVSGRHVICYYNNYRYMTIGNYMVREFSKSTFKTHALEIMRGVEKSGEDVVITAHGKRALVIKPYTDNSVSPLEKLKGTVVNYIEPTLPVCEDDWELA